MAYSVAAAYASAMLAHLGDIANGNTPSRKITPVGYLRALAENNPGFRTVREGYLENGHIRDVRIAYQQRFVEGWVQTTPNCDIDVVPVYKEVTTNIEKYVSLGIYIDDRTIARYIDEASRTVDIPGASPQAPAGMFMQEHLDSVLNAANALFQKVDRILLTKQEANWGVNAANAATTKTINVEVDGTINDLGTGMTEIINDMQLNEFSGTPFIVGGGIFNKYHIQQRVKSADSAGVNTKGFESEYNYYFDILSQSVWGANEIGVFSPGSVILLDYNLYGGSFAGDKMTSFNFKMALPVVESVTGASLGFFTFDAKIMRINCPTEVTVGPYNDPQTVNEGWQLVLSKYFDQFNIPNDAYNGLDRLTGNNGTLRYAITNS